MLDRVIKKITNEIKNRLGYDYKNKILEWDELFDLYDINNNILDESIIVSFYRKNIDRTIVDNQKRVFELFKLNIVQIEMECTHGEFMDYIITEFVKSKAYIIFFDIDCIPLNQLALIKLFKSIQKDNTLSGAAQTATHKLGGKNIYVGPFFMGFSTKIIQGLEKFSMEKSGTYDVGGILTHLCKVNDVNIDYWFPTEVEVIRWKLYPNHYFGLGTTYDGLIYHAFEIRIGSKNRFNKKCNSVIKYYK